MNQPYNWITFTWSRPEPINIWEEPGPSSPISTLANWVVDHRAIHFIPDLEDFTIAVCIWTTIIVLSNIWARFRLEAYCFYDCILEPALRNAFNACEVFFENPEQIIERKRKELIRQYSDFCPILSKIQDEMKRGFRHAICYDLRIAITYIIDILNRTLESLNQHRNRLDLHTAKLEACPSMRSRPVPGPRKKPPGWAYAPVTESARTYVARMEAEQRRLCSPCECPVPDHPTLCLQLRGHDADDQAFIHRLLTEYNRNELFLELHDEQFQAEEVGRARQMEEDKSKRRVRFNYQESENS